MAGQDPALRNIILGTAAVNLGIPLGAQIADVADGDTSAGEIGLNQLISLLGPLGASAGAGLADIIDPALRDLDSYKRLDDFNQKEQAQKIIRENPNITEKELIDALLKQPIRRRQMAALGGGLLGSLLAARRMQDKPESQEN